MRHIRRIIEKLKEEQGKEFCLKDGRSFTYTFNGNDIYIEDKNWHITENDIAAALDYRSGLAEYDIIQAEKYSYIFSLINLYFNNAD